ncbi:hypothetical protein [Brevibacterium jeotgali]|uniref:Uncharacterized protein n=1 Tax=Brevibacterium jeotgali TaxID=1262550 RepID=A0A2H1L1Q4_9MICO|nr:hypothetical protein [Brevibacterium jeotgali]TWC01880.1 hypothetical protein FB108_0538 [Brevibacterium jeotgali]SMY10769.1 hypothetical protein BJEO58_00344 [Brevibacterium jeotgali]
MTQPMQFLPPRRSRQRIRVLLAAAVVLGVLNSVAYHSAAISGWIPHMQVPDRQLVGVLLGSDLILGLLALCLVPAAIAHDTEELEEDSYIGPPSALVAGLVVITVWQVAPLAMAGGAIVIISISSRVSASWTVPAICASILSALISQLAFQPQQPGLSWGTIGMTTIITLLLVALGTVRGKHLRSLRWPPGGSAG